MDARFESLPGGLDAAWAEPWPAERLRKLRRAAEATRRELLGGGPVSACITRNLVTFPYPTRYAFSGAALSPAPMVMMTNRMQVVQFDHGGRRRTLLFNPSDVERNKAATFYARLQERFGGPLSERVMSTRHGSVQEHLAALNLSPADVDYLAYDHLHVQDLRGWLGGPNPVFPNAKLLVHEAEWEETRDLHPMNAVWYVPGATEIDPGRVQTFKGSVRLAPGLALVATPGHTLGNMSLFVVTPGGTFVTSENGVATESYTPEHSTVPGVAAGCEAMGYEVVLNGNTREGSLDQYSSMVVEKILAGPSQQDPRFCAFCPSSELTPSLFAPGLSPTYRHLPPDTGTLVSTSRH
jgi:glyoxylase-like metal-dependent hydrolase (beta-lactamase superfamily II)